MLYHIEFLRFRKGSGKTPIQMCWCAATTKNFVGLPGDGNKVSKEDLASMRISEACDSLINELLHNNEEEPRLNLYMASQLMYGILRIFKEQTDLAIDQYALMISNLTSIMLSTDPEIQTKKNKKSKNVKKNQMEVVEDLILNSPHIINLEKAFPGSTPEDTHLIEDFDLPPHVDPAELSFDFPNNLTTDHEALEDLQQKLLSEPFLDESPAPIKNIQEIISDLNVELSQSQKANERTQEDAISTTPKLQSRRKRPRKVLEQFKDSSEDLSLESMRASHPTLSKKNYQPTSASSDILLTSPVKVVSNIFEEEPIPMEVSEAIHEAALPSDDPIRDSSVRHLKSGPQIEPMDTTSELQIPIDSVDNPVLGFSRRIHKAARSEDSLLEDELAKLEVGAPGPSLNFSAVSELSNLNISTQNMNPEQVHVKKRKRPRVVKQKCVHESKQILLVDRSFENWKKHCQKVDPRKKESTNSLFSNPASLKKRFHHRLARLWSKILHQNFEKAVEFCRLYTKENKNDHSQIPEEMSQEEDEPQGKQQPPELIVRDIRIVLERITISDVLVKIQGIHINPPLSQTDHLDFEDFTSRMQDNLSTINDQHYDQQLNSNDPISSPIIQNKLVDRSQRLCSNAEIDCTSSVTEIYRLINELWYDGNHAKDGENCKVSFEEVFPPSGIDVIGVIRCLMQCFSLERERKLELFQENPYETLYIIEPKENSTNQRRYCFS